MTGKQQPNAVIAKALVGVMGVESDVAPPARARSSSFASTVSDLNVGDAPASKVQPIDNTLTVAEALAQMSDAGERLRNSVTSSVAQAKRKNPGAEYSVEITDIKTKSGFYSLALIHRTA
jgi:predicted RNA-binding protein with TRAM domain